MTKLQLIEKLEELREEMFPLIVLSGLDVSKFQLLDGYKDIHIKHIREAYHWLETLRRAQWREAKTVRDLCTEEVWMRYALREERHFREVKMMETAFKNLRKEFVKRPHLFIKTECEKLIHGQHKAANDRVDQSDECRA